MLGAARAHPETLAVGVDAVADAMAASSRKAARRNALPNAVFVVAAAQHPP